MRVKFSNYLLTVFLFSGASIADDASLPEVASRTYEQNYKDLALAQCISQAYANESKAAADAGATAAGLQSTWTNYDIENGGGEIARLVNQYLAREYHSTHGADIKLDLLKCLDLYHSKELDKQAKKLVINPKRSYKQDSAKDLK